MVGSAAHAALNTWSTSYGQQCDSSNYYCCKADALSADYAWAGLWYDSNHDGVPPMTVTTNTTYKVRARAKCEPSTSFTTGVWSVDNMSCNHLGQCSTNTGWETSRIACPSNNTPQCMLAEE